MTEREAFPANGKRPVVVHDGEFRVLQRDFALYSKRKGAVLKLKKGFRFYASIPRPFWSVIAPSDCGDPASGGHDALYQSGGDPATRPDICEVYPAGTTWKRGEADGDFADWMKHDEKKGTVRVLAWLGVRIGGRSSWKRAK